jgi:glycosyltransferase involved in cell wall biosynthesis
LTDQILQECEFIIVLDGAPEAESSICENHAARDSRFRLFRREHAGVSATRNYGIKQVQGEYIAFVDSDDWIDKSMLQEVYAFAKKNNSDILTMDFYETKNKIDILRNQKPLSVAPLSILHQILIGKMFGGMPIRIIKKDFYDKHPTKFLESIGYCEDVLFWAQFLQEQPKIDYLNKAFYHYVQDNNNSITHDFTTDKYKERKKFIQALKDILPKTFERDINMAAFNVKMEAMKNKLLTPAEYLSFERTRLDTLLRSNQTWVTKVYLLLHSIFLAIFNKTYKENL